MDRPLVIRTWLSRRPREGALAVALSALVILTGLTVAGWTDPEGSDLLFAASRERIFRDGELWRLLSTVGLHANPKHFLSNALFAGGLTFLIYGYYGPSAFPFLVGAGTALTTALSLLTYPAHVRLIGASGAVYLMAAFWLGLYMALERRHAIPMRIIRATRVALVLLIPATFEPGTSHRTHAIGFGVGLLAALIYFLMNRDLLRSAEEHYDPDADADPPAEPDRPDPEGEDPDDQTFHYH